MYIQLLSTFAQPWSGHAPALPTELKLTLHTALVQVAMNTIVVGGEDAEEPDTSKI